MNIEWIGQSGYILRTAEATLVLRSVSVGCRQPCSRAAASVFGTD